MKIFFTKFLETNSSNDSSHPDDFEWLTEGEGKFMSLSLGDRLNLNPAVLNSDPD